MFTFYVLEKQSTKIAHVYPIHMSTAYMDILNSLNFLTTVPSEK